MAELIIRNLHVSIEGNEIVKGLNLTLPQGEVHAIMGPNGPSDLPGRRFFALRWIAFLHSPLSIRIFWHTPPPPSRPVNR